MLRKLPRSHARSGEETRGNRILFWLTLVASIITIVVFFTGAQSFLELPADLAAIEQSLGLS